MLSFGDIPHYHFADSPPGGFQHLVEMHGYERDQLITNNEANRIHAGLKHASQPAPTWPDTHYDEVVLFRHWDGLIGPSSHSEEIKVYSCKACAALVDESGLARHQDWHDNHDSTS